MNNNLKVIASFKKIQDKFPALMANEMIKTATDLNALIIKRVQNVGLNAESNSFGEYEESTKKKKVKDDHTESPYPKVNFTDTGAMFKSQRVKLVEESPTKIIVRITPTQSENEEKMKWNQKRFGKIIEASPDEIALTKKLVQKRVSSVIKKILK